MGAKVSKSGCGGAVAGYEGHSVTVAVIKIVIFLFFAQFEDLLIHIFFFFPKVHLLGFKIDFDQFLLIFKCDLIYFIFSNHYKRSFLHFISIVNDFKNN